MNTELELKMTNLKNKKCEVLEVFPSRFFSHGDKDIFIETEQFLKSLKENYQYYIVKVKNFKNIKEVLSKLKNTCKLLKLKGLFIIECFSTGELLDLFIFDKNNMFYDRHFDNAHKSIKAGHQLYNASKDFKLRQAVGRDRVQRFKAYIMRE